MADGFEVAKAYVTIVPSMAGSQAEITKELTGVTNEASEKAGEEGGSKFGEKFAGALKGATAAVGAAMTAVTGAAVAAGKAFIDTANSVSSAGDAIGDNAAKMGISTQAYQEWDFVLQRAGSSIDSMKTSMKTLANAAVNGSEAFEALGISQEQLASMSQEEIFGATVTALQSVEDETTRTALASKLLGKGALELGGVFNMTTEELEATKQEMYDLGVYMDEDMIAASDNYQDTMLNMQDSVKGLKNSMVKDFLPGITSVMDGLSKVFSGNGGTEEIQEGLQNVINNITKLSPQFFSLAETLIMSLISGFAPMLPQLVSSVFSVIVQAITTITTMIPQMMPSIIAGIQGILTALMQALPVIVQGLTQLIVALVSWLAEGNNVQTFDNGIIQLVTEIANSLAMILPVLIPAIVQIIAELAKALTEPDNVMMILDAVLTIVGAVVVALVESLPAIGDLIVGVLTNLGELLGRFFEWIVPIVANVIGKIVDTVKSWGNNIKTFITNLVNNIKTGFNNWLNNLKTSFTNAFTAIKTKVQSIINNIKTFVTNCINTIKELPQKVVNIGKNLVEGLWNGINDKIGWVKNKIAGMGSAITSAIKGVFGIASPSKIWRDEIGSMLAQGIGVGFTDEMADVKDDMTDSMNGLTGSMTADVSAYGAQGAMLGGTTNYNGGNITINVYGAEGQSVDAIAQAVAYKLEDMTRRKGAVYA